MTWQQHPDCPANGARLCAVADIPDGGGLEVTFGAGSENFKILLLRQEARVWSYVNRCPHFSLPLNYEPQNFIAAEGLIMCAHHTAFFRIDSGECVDGPCAGTGLTALPAYCHGGEVYFGSRHHGMETA